MSSPTARGSAAAALSAPVFPSVETEARMHTNKPGTEGRISAGVFLWRELRPGCCLPYQLGTEGRISAGVILWQELRPGCSPTSQELRPAYELQTEE